MHVPAEEMTEEFGTKIDRLSAIRERASSGDRKAIETLERLGVTYAQFANANLSNADLAEMFTFSDATGRMDALEAFGRGGPKVIAILKALKEQKDKTPIVSTEDIDRIDHAEKKLQKLLLTLKSIGAVELADQLTAHGMASLLLNPWGHIASRVATRFNPTFQPEARARDTGGSNEPGSPDFIGPLPFAPLSTKPKEDADKAEIELQKAVLELQLKQLRPYEKKLELQQQITELTELARIAEEQGTDAMRETAAGFRKDAVKVAGELFALENTGLSKVSVPEMQSTGILSVFGAGAAARESIGSRFVGNPDEIPRRQLTVAEQQRDLLRRIADKEVINANFPAN